MRALRRKGEEVEIHSGVTKYLRNKITFINNTVSSQKIMKEFQSVLSPTSANK